MRRHEDKVVSHTFLPYVRTVCGSRSLPHEVSSLVVVEGGICMYVSQGIDAPFQAIIPPEGRIASSSERIALCLRGGFPLVNPRLGARRQIRYSVVKCSVADDPPLARLCGRATGLIIISAWRKRCWQGARLSEQSMAPHYISWQRKEQR